jgi:hypothetical protein
MQASQYHPSESIGSISGQITNGFSLCLINRRPGLSEAIENRSLSSRSQAELGSRIVMVNRPSPDQPGISVSSLGSGANNQPT